MEPLMGDPGPRHPDVNDGAPTAADDASTLVLGSCFVLEIAPADTSRGGRGRCRAEAREAAAHYGSWSELRGGGRRPTRRIWPRARAPMRDVRAV